MNGEWLGPFYNSDLSTLQHLSWAWRSRFIKTAIDFSRRKYCSTDKKNWLNNKWWTNKYFVGRTMYCNASQIVLSNHKNYWTKYGFERLYPNLQLLQLIFLVSKFEFVPTAWNFCDIYYCIGTVPICRVLGSKRDSRISQYRWYGESFGREKYCVEAWKIEPALIPPRA